MKKPGGSYRSPYPAKRNNAHAQHLAMCCGAGRLEEAIESFEQAIALKADYVDAYTNLAAVRVRRNELDQAVACYERALAIAPDSPRLHFNLANLLPRQGRLDEAIESTAGQSRSSLIFRSLFNLRQPLRQIGRPEEAVACCKQALALKSDFADALCNLGIALKDLDRWRKP